MPYISCLFASASDRMLAALREDPDCRDRLHRFREVEGVDLSGGELFVVHLQGSVDAPWPDVHEGYSPMAREAWSGPLPSEILTPPFDAHTWLSEALPPPEALARWSRISAITGERLALWWWWERGDTLYSDLTWLFSPEGATLLVRETTEVGDEERTFQYPPPPEGAPLEEVPLHAAMKHLGFQSSLQYFIPTDSWHFDWAPYRVSEGDSAAVSWSPGAKPGDQP